MAIANSPANSPTLSAGAAWREITPPLEVGLLMSSVEGRWEKFEGIRKGLFARAVVLEGESAGGTFQRAAIVALDLLALSGKALGGFDEFKARIAAAAGYAVKADRDRALLHAQPFGPRVWRDHGTLPNACLSSVAGVSDDADRRSYCGGESRRRSVSRELLDVHSSWLGNSSTD